MLGVSTAEVSKKLLEKGPIGPKEILVFQSGIFSQQIPASVIVGFAVNSHWIFQQEEKPRWLKFTFQTKIQWCVLPSFLKWCGFHTRGQNEACG